MNASSKVALTLPDGSVREYDGLVTGMTLAQDIGPGLAKAAIVIIVNGEQRDLSYEITSSANVSIITKRDEEALEIIRHDAAHILAEAVKELWPETQVTIGPAIENGFYYDFAREEPFTPEDLEIMETRMKEIVARDEDIIRSEMLRDDAVELFRTMGEKYKAEIIASIPSNEPISLYKQGNFIDLCRGPHLPSTRYLGEGTFKLMTIAGAYWRGDSNNEMLQRVYGTAWRDKKELKAYLHRIEEAEKRDHRKLGRELNLFHFQEEAAGMPFWHPNGWTIYTQIEGYMRRKQREYGYQEINTPKLVDRKLWEDSGHWEKFREHMYTTESEERIFALKPMNCPCHVQVFNQGLVSYRDLPLRLAEFGSCHRNEPSGALHGLMRVRSFVQDDAHIFCEKDKITEETETFCGMLLEIYKDFGFEKIKVKFSDRPEVRAGSDDVWDEAEKCLLDAVDHVGLEYTLNPGEGAFYGPKLEFVLTDAIGRDWQCGTLQVDFVLPERLDANYVGADNTKHRPVMLHRAILGSFERFIGILIENFAGRFPMWLAPIQVVVTGITNDQDAYVNEVYMQLKSAGLRAEIDTRNEKINYKIREHSHAKIPAIFVAGGREADNNTITIRRLGSKNQETLDLTDAINTLVTESIEPDKR
ncbi:MAG: threonine--tRNA ligase [Kordiimonadaceae bacterium]|jgi:threonyl-tRNA synthetase|nr:threonine--tRNA ligase [Kordiimonadaceae bacterium]MBT7545566.1 threonine--tRNA ligase [Kordiimonadaceae bacterium]MBT7604325.1 threonine--tRNA ligase [Kordiimonadaceae bacterium]MDC0081212.1 threonine--tRNA ligase [Emcibacteraceae bacterium]MDC1429426.1 threonine--tRNA ligase [Emcibacteraceae bacterium]|tara:strand:+ start:13357 stop:15291 length:1935 start_codon:yes stop_codon:yes gene_type:complete